MKLAQLVGRSGVSAIRARNCESMLLAMSYDRCWYSVAKYQRTGGSRDKL